MGNILWAVVSIGGPIVIAAAVVYGLLTHILKSRPLQRSAASDEPTMPKIVRSDQSTEPRL
jgi:hypothetical protein